MAESPQPGHSTALPASERLLRRLLDSVQDGTLPAGQRLPPVRDQAVRLGLAANTVAKAYRELERRGVLVTRGRHGTFVASRDDAQGKAAEAADAYARRARDLGLDASEALRIVTLALSDQGPTLG